MRYTPEHKAETRQKIVAAAARQFRARGLEAVSVADVMAEAGLTHGGFYAHFASKDELLEQALMQGNDVGAGKLKDAARNAQAGEGLTAIVNTYLSESHRARREQGCILASLAQEAGRDSPQARRVLAERSHMLAKLVRHYMPETGHSLPEDAERAIVACLVGGLILSRLEADPGEGSKTLAACRKFILDAAKA